MSKNTIEINPEFKKALQYLEKSTSHVFITGKAGTGKSTLLGYFREHTRKKVVVLAPTGVAALNVRGETIHSFFRFKPDITLEKVREYRGKRKKIYQAVEMIIIDEVSMVRADLLDCIDAFLRLNGRCKQEPFGGAQMVFIGDLYQLPPVVNSQEKEFFSVHYKSPYFFSARAFAGLAMEFIELEKVYRQKDQRFIALLNAIRNNSITEEHLEELNTRVGAELPEERSAGFTVHLTTTNKAAESINQEHLAALKTPLYTYASEIDGDFDERSYPALSAFQVGVGAQVMGLNNDAQGRWVNGSIGKVTDIRKTHKGKDLIIVEFSGGRAEEVSPYSWELFHFTFNEETQSIETDIVGTFTQYPLKLAWAVTIHKSQGKTFERTIIDVGPTSFAGGQTYVALSRCTSFEGISLKRPVKKHHVFTDRRVVEFLTRYQYGISEGRVPLEEKIRIIEAAIQSGSHLEITYLKKSDEKTHRRIKPYRVGEMSYENKPFIGVQAYCLNRNEDRTFRVDRILEIAAADPS